MKNRIPGRILIGVLLGVLCALLVSGAQRRGWLEIVERNVLDSLFRARGTQFPSDKIVLVVADDATVARAGNWPLPRGIYADVIRELHRSRTKTIAFDIVFSQASASRRDDEALARACRDSGSVVSAAVFQLPSGSSTQSTPASKSTLAGNTLVAGSPLDLPAENSALLPRFGFSPQQNFVRERAVPASGVIAPRLAMQQNSVRLGHINATPDSDGVLRHLAHLIEYRGTVYPSLAIAATAHFLDVPLREIEAAPDGSLVLPAAPAPLKVPLLREAGVLVNWIGGTRSFPTYSFDQLLSGSVPEEALGGRIAIVGVTASAAFDHHSSPFSPAQPAVEFQANAINDILLQRVLRPAAPLLQFALLGFVAVFAGAVMTRSNTWKSVLLAFVFAAGLWGVAFVLFAQNYYLPVGAPILATFLTLAVATSYRQLSDVRKLKRAEERYALAAQGSNDGLWDWDIRAGVLYFSPRWQEIIGGRGDKIAPPNEWLTKVHVEDREQLDADIETHLAGLSPHLENEHRLRHRDGTYRWVSCRGLAVRGDDGKAIRMAGSISDITERKITEAQIRFDALHDGLSGLPNRTLLANLLERAVEQKKLHDDYNFALLLFDIDHFKFVNDSLGHEAGDELLVKIAQRLKSGLRSESTPARLGGDEFAVLYDTSGSLIEVSRAAEQIQSTLAEPFHIKEQEVFVTISIGIVHNVTEYSRPEEIIRDAEIAMYRAKSAGRVRYEIFDANMHRQVVSRLKLESDLRRALERQEFLLYYQPIVSLLDGRIAGFEALIRWQNADGVLVSPAEFIPLAEETGLITEMDLWGLEQACAQLREWNSQRDVFTSQGAPLFASVNLSRKLFSLPDLVPRIRAILEKTRLEPGCLKLEITESAIVDNTASAAATLHELKALGAQISIDDFGTGYSSLSYLHHFPLDVLKIDRSFISGMESDEGKHKIVWTIIAMARNLGMDVVAEGVEEHEQVQILQTLTCDFCQGYFFSEPLPRDEAETLLKSAPRWSTPVGLAPSTSLDLKPVNPAFASTLQPVQKSAI